MSHIDQIHNVVIIDNKSAGNYTRMLDCFRPKEARRCFLSVSKFKATVNVTGLELGSHNIVLSVEGVENSYSNDINSKVIVRSSIIDAYSTSNILVVANSPIADRNGEYAYFNENNSTDTWIEISMNDLNNFRLSLKSASTQTDLLGNITYSDVSNDNFPFFLQLKVKFE